MGVDVVTFGCRLNAFESGVMAREAEAAGLTDIIVINSCAVTNEAVAQARQSIRKLKRERPDARIVVTGCAAQTQGAVFAEMAEVNRVLGNDDKMRGEAWRATAAALDAGTDSADKIGVSDIMKVKEMAPHLMGGFQAGRAARLRAGAERLRSPLHLLHHPVRPRQFALGADRGGGRAGTRTSSRTAMREIVLTGVDLTSYGADLPGTPKLGMLVKNILASCARTAAAADLVDRFDRGRCRPA